MSNISHDDEGTGKLSQSGSTDASLTGRQTAQKSRRTWWLGLAALVVVALAVGLIWAWRSNGKGTVGGGLAATDSITVGLKLAPTNLDIRNQSGAALDQVLIGNVYESLVSTNEKNQVVPGLAKSWDISDSGKTYTFHLNSGMSFSNGDKLDASSLAWSIQQLIAHRYVNYQLLKNVQSVAAQGPDTLVIKLSAPYASLLWNLSGRAGLALDQKAQYDAKTQAVGSGPYLLTSFKANESITLTRNEHYWGADKAKIKTVTLRYFADDNAALNAFKSGSIQVLAPVMNAQMGQSLKANSNFVVGQGEGTDKYVLGMNNKGPVLKDIKVRQAIRYAIDHAAIIASRGGVDRALGGPIPSLDPGYEDLTGLFPHDPAKAKQLLAEAGYGPSHPLSLRLEYANIYGPQFGDQLKSQLATVGINLQVKVVEFSTWLQDVYTNHDYDLSLVDHNESHDFYQWTDPTYYFGYDSPVVQGLYARAMAATDPQQQNALLAQAARQVSQDAAADWLLNYRVTTAYDKNVTGFPMNLNQSRLPLAQVAYKG